MKVFVFTTVHKWNDTRVFFRQVQTLAKHYLVELHAVADFNERIENGVSIKGVRPWANLGDRIRSIWNMLFRILKSDADIFHFHDPELMILSPFIKIIKKKKVIFDVHEHYPNLIHDKPYLPKTFRFIISLVYRMIENLMLPFIDHVVYVTDSVGERYVKKKKTNASMIRNLPLRSIFQEEPKVYSDRKKELVYIGYIEPIRGIEELIKAFKKVHTQHDDYILILVGRFFSEIYQKKIIQLIDHLNLSSVIDLRGMVPYSDLQTLLNESRIGYITYLSYQNNMAGLPNKLFEYMGAGLAIIASDFTSYRSVLEKNGKCAEFVIPENSDEIAAATLRLIEDDSYSSQMAIRARSSFIEEFNWESEQQKLLDIYSQWQ